LQAFSGDQAHNFAMPIAALLLALTISGAPIAAPAPVTTTLILRNGTRFEVEGPIREEQARIIFRTSGALYSIPLADVDMDATRAAVTRPVVVTADSSKKLKVSSAERDRLLRELEQNHSGTPSEASSSGRISVPPEPQEPPKGDEWSWRAAARDHEEAVRRARENVDLLRNRAEALKQQIQQFFALGYHANQFTYQSSELEVTLSQLPPAELEVTRAQRANDQFRDDARRQGIMPGWLR
jgi:hypothetical protein